MLEAKGDKGGRPGGAETGGKKKSLVIVDAPPAPVKEKGGCC